MVRKAARHAGSMTVSLRIPITAAERAESMVEWASTQRDVASTGHATRADVLRAALLVGLDTLSRRQARHADGGE